MPRRRNNPIDRINEELDIFGPIREGFRTAYRGVVSFFKSAFKFAKRTA